MFSRIRSAVCHGIEGRDVFVETDVARGLPGIYIVGLASTMIMESRERIKSAIINSGFEYPRGRITINLTPASLRKNGSCLDLPIAAGLLTSNLFLDPSGVSEYGMIGELALDGRVLGVSGVLPMLIRMKESGISKVIVPMENVAEGALVGGIDLYPVRSLKECAGIISGERKASPYPSVELRERVAALSADHSGLFIDPDIGDFSEISGQENAKRAITIAVTGRHGLLMIGSPGCGKTMLSKRIPTIMPPMTSDELLDTSIIYSAAGKGRYSSRLSLMRPFRSPHHTIGRAGLIGGGAYPVPGEVSLAHNGVLFLDEVCEMDRECIEALRIPVEERRITHFRLGESYTFPCSFQMIMASNPCPCGYFGDDERLCKCTEAQLERYRKKLSGPMMDRIDMKVTMEHVTYQELGHDQNGMSSAEMRAQVISGIEFARANGRTKFNALMNEPEIDEFCKLGTEENRFMERAYNAFRMSPRSYKRTVKVARTIADLAGSCEIKQEHLAEALSYRIEDMPE